MTSSGCGTDPHYVPASVRSADKEDIQPEADKELKDADPCGVSGDHRAVKRQLAAYTVTSLREFCGITRALRVKRA